MAFKMDSPDIQYTIDYFYMAYWVLPLVDQRFPKLMTLFALCL